MEKSAAKTVKDLIAWKKSYKLALNIYDLTKSFPAQEQYGLVQQMRRAAVSIPSNIAEGYARKHSAEFMQFTSIAYGSLSELLTQYMLAVDLGYAKQNLDLENLMDEVGAMLYTLSRPKS